MVTRADAIKAKTERVNEGTAVVTVSSKTIKATDLELAVRRERESYRIQLEQLIRNAEDAMDKLKTHGRVSSHDGANLMRSASDLQALATKIDLLENLVRFSE